MEVSVMAKDVHDRIIGHSAPISRDDMMKRVARFADQVPDLKAFLDLADAARKRDVVYRRFRRMRRPARRQSHSRTLSTWRSSH